MKKKNIVKLLNCSIAKNNKRAAFTLIELLIVIVILGMLATITIASFARGKAKARDSRRVADLNSIQMAVDMFRDTEKRWPGTASSWYQSNHTPWWQGNGNTLFETEIALYLSPLPRDPLRNILHLGDQWTELCYRFWWENSSQSYKLDSGMEVRKDLVDNDGGIRQLEYKIKPDGTHEAYPGCGGDVTVNCQNELNGRYEIGTKLNLMD